MPETCAGCVLLVDDDSVLRELLSRHLAKAGFEALHAEDGLDAVEKLRNTLPRVIISDLQMPRMSGIEFIGILRKRFPTIPVIVLSGEIPRELPEDINPDCWIEKSVLSFPVIVQTVDELARKAPNDVELPQVVSLPVKAGPGFGGYSILTCPDCLRTFRAETGGQTTARSGIAVCTHCDARVPFVIESSVPH